MSSKPYRLAEGWGRIDRLTNRVTFTFDGKDVCVDLLAIRWLPQFWRMGRRCLVALSSITGRAVPWAWVLKK